MHHSTTHVTKVAPIDEQITAPTVVKVGIAPECRQMGSRGAGAALRCPVHQRWRLSSVLYSLAGLFYLTSNN